jgi:glycosyltransferase involved in cell wall biosynthesis
MRIALFTLDNLQFPSPQIRLIEPLGAAPEKVQLFNGVQLMERRQPMAVDMVIVQRGFPRPGALRDVCAELVQAGVPVVYETDDDLRRVPDHHNKPGYDERLASNIEWLCAQADLVTVSTDFLAEAYAPFSRRVEVLPNFLSRRLWNDTTVNACRADGRIRIGLVGSSNHQRDFETLVPLLNDTMREHPLVDCVFYGAVPAGLSAGDRVSHVPPNYAFAQHPARLASLGIDIALVPLTPSRFNRAKSNIKFLEYGFLGIPGLYADLEPYRASVAHGQTGFLCDQRPDSWRHALRELIEDTDLRQRIGQSAKREVLSRHMLDQHAHRWPEAYRRAAALRQVAGPSRTDR